MILKYRAKDANSTQGAENEVGRMHNARLAKQRHKSSWLSATHKLLELSKSLSCFGALVHVSYASLFWRALRVCNAEGSKFFATVPRSPSQEEVDSGSYIQTSKQTMH